MLGVLLPVLLAAAPGAQPVPLSLADALRLAEQHNLDLAAATLAIPVAEQGVRAASALPNPSLTVSYGRDTPKWIEGITQSVPFFGHRAAAIAAAEAEVPIARAELDARRIEIRIRVRRAYIALATVQASNRYAQEAYRVMEELAASIHRRYEAGKAIELHALQAELALARVRQEILDREAALQNAQYELAEAIGQLAPGPLEASDPLWPVPEPPPLEPLLSQGARHPDVVGQVAQRDAALARVHQERVAAWPVPLVTFALEQQGGAPPAVWLRGTVAVDLPILSQNQGAIAEQQARADQAEAGARAQTWAHLAKIRAAHAQVAAAGRRARYFHDEVIPISARVVDLTRTEYEAGRVPLTTLLQVITELVHAWSDGLDSYRETWDALTDLEEASGGPLQD